MTKERFVEVINFIKKSKELENKFCDLLEEMSPETYVNAYIYNDYESMLLETLKEAMNVDENNDIIEYFIYDLEFGKVWKPGMITDDGKDINLSSVEKLYDYLTKGENK